MTNMRPSEKEAIARAKRRADMVHPPKLVTKDHTEAIRAAGALAQSGTACVVLRLGTGTRHAVHVDTPGGRKVWSRWVIAEFAVPTEVQP